MSRYALVDIATEMARQKEIHPLRPCHPHQWHTVFTEEGLEALAELIKHWLEISRLTQEQADGPCVQSWLAGAKLRTELIQMAAVAASWAETLEEKE